MKSTSVAHAHPALLGFLPGAPRNKLYARFLAFTPEADVNFVLADVRITHRKVGQPGGKERVNQVVKGDPNLVERCDIASKVVKFRVGAM